MMSNADENSAPDRISLVTAINTKYGTLYDRTQIPSDPNAQLLPSPRESSDLILKIKTSDHLPGKRRASGSLELLVLNDKHINRAGDLNDLALLVKNITQLDLANNYICCWKEVCQILHHMPLLEHCNLSHNQLSQTTLPSCSELQLTKLTSLVLNGTQIGWPCLLKLLRQTLHLEELHLSLNDYSSVETTLLSNRNSKSISEKNNDPHLSSQEGNDAEAAAEEESFPNVHILHINHCHLRSWPAFVKICRLFPCLETIVAAENPIETIVDDCEEMREMFSCLHSLNVNKWPIVSWDDVDRFRYFPLLTELRISHIPLLENFNEDERRLLMIARLPDVSLLNGSTVTPLNREDAERFFLRYYLDQEQKPARYFELENVHGQLNKLLDVDLSPKEQAEVKLVFQNDDETEMYSTTTRIGLNQTVAEFKKSLQSFCGLQPSKMRVWYRDIEAEGVMGMEELRYPKQMLHSLRVADGDEFHIQAKPEPNPPRRRTSSSNSSQSTMSPVKH